MKTKYESSIEDRVLDNETSDPSFEEEEYSKEDAELRMKR
jgi:hypothetical protein